jgi:hypothetical protein
VPTGAVAISIGGLGVLDMTAHVPASASSLVTRASLARRIPSSVTQFTPWPLGALRLQQNCASGRGLPGASCATGLLDAPEQDRPGR